MPLAESLQNSIESSQNFPLDEALVDSAIREAQANYAQYSETGASLLHDLRSKSDEYNLKGISPQYATSQIEGYLGSGSDKDVFLREVNGEPTVFKLLRQKSDQPSSATEAQPHDHINDQALPLIAGSGIPHLEQLKAIDPTGRVLVTSYIPGVRPMDGKSVIPFSIRKQHLVELKDTLRLMAERNLHFHNVGGILFDEKSGFGFVDYTFEYGQADVIAPTNDISEVVQYLLADHKKYNALTEMKNNGANLPASAYQTTGLRGLGRAVALRKASKL